MSNKSGVADQVISLPEGGGALNGIGEKFSPELFTGTGNFSVPIDLPEGRNGLNPELTLAYSTANGNGSFGLGWRLSVPGVSRKTSDGVPVYDDSSDVFVLSESEDLVAVAAGDDDADRLGRQRYRPRTEESFDRIVHHTGPEDDYWEVRSKDGLTSQYGTPEARGDDPAVVADPAERENVFEWNLTRTVDPFGNEIAYEYTRDAGAHGRRSWDQVYLKRIRYVDHEHGGETAYLVSVTFDYEDRPDAFSSYDAGFEIRTRKRCERIEVRTHPDGDPDNGELVKSYELTYLDEQERSEDRRPLNGVSLLSEIRIVGHDGDETEQLPPLEFGYTRFEPEGREFFPLKGDLPQRSLASPDLELADLFGNGLPDIVQIDGTVRYWRNRGGGRFDEPREMRASPAGLELADAGVQLIDANGDGGIDLLSATNDVTGYFPLQYGGEWDRRSFQPYDVAPSFSLANPEVQLVDLTGDGVTDAIRSGSGEHLDCFFNDPQEGWNETRRVSRHGLDVSFSDPRVKWGDLSGDGLQDVVLVHDGSVDYWPNLGHGEWGPRVSMENGPRFPYGYDPERILIGDVDGDGLADLVYVDTKRVLVWINRSGNGWSDPIEIDGTPPVTDADAVRLGDLLGTGVPGLLWSSDVQRGPDSAFFLDFTGGRNPYLLNEMDNNRGATTRVEYAPSTQFYRMDEKRPETRWETPLPFPVQVVSQVEQIDVVSGGKQTTEYRYHHGYWDGAEREFRGFGMVEQRDTETFETYNDPGLHGDEADFERVGEDDQEQFSPPVLTKTWFHQGPIGDEFGTWEAADYSHEYWSEDPQVLTRESATGVPQDLPRRDRRDALRALRGRVLRTERYALDGSQREDRPYTVTERRYGVREEQPPEGSSDRRRIFFPHERARRTTHWERGDDPMTRFTFTGDYDAYGQSRSEIKIAVPRNRDFNASIPSADEPYLATKTETTYAQRDDADRYIVDRVARTTRYEIPNDGSDDVFTLKRQVEDETLAERPILIGQTVNFYDGAAFRGQPFTELGDHGALVRTEELVLTDEIIRETYDVDDVASVPPYLAVDGAADWSEYPDEFRERLLESGAPDETRPNLRITPVGYGYTDGDDTYARGYFVATERREYDFQDGGSSQGLLKTKRNPLGADTSIVEYDDFGLFPVDVEDPAGLTTRAEYNYRVLELDLIANPNGNRVALTFTPLGLPESIALMGEAGEEVGDTLERPGIWFEYDFSAFETSPGNGGQPVYVHTTKRERHHWDLVHGDDDSPERLMQTRKYFDGFGRQIQTRTQAEDLIFSDRVDESPFGGIDLLTDQTVVVRDDGAVPTSLDDLEGQRIGARERTVAAVFVKERLLEPGIDIEDFETYSSEFQAVVDLESGEVDAIVFDASVATTFTTERDGVVEAFSTGPGEIVGHELPDETGPRVTVSGWKTYDNKGRIVEKYEPFFATGWEYLSRGEATEKVFGKKTSKYYDPRGRVIRTVNPDGSERRVVHGIPDEAGLTTPDEYAPTPWEAYTYDPNDNAGRTHNESSPPSDPHVARVRDYRHHWDTPSSETVDALGRTVETVERTRAPLEPLQEYRTRSTYDLRGNVLTETDPLGREAAAYTYDLGDNRLRTESIDAGIRVTVLDAAGNEIEHRDSKGALVLQAYDDLNRPIRRWARDDADGSITLRERLVYGDGPETGFADTEEERRAIARERNLLGRPYRHYDEAGEVTFEAYDIKGNVLEKSRRVISDDAIRRALPIDWQPPPGVTFEEHADTFLEEDTYRTSTTYDALNRVSTMRYPDTEDVDGSPTELHPQYNRAGELERIELVSDPGTAEESSDTYVERIAYNAKGQRTFIAYGNGTLTRYAYDPETFRPVRICTQSYEMPDDAWYRPDGAPLQYFDYEYDLAGNVTMIRDRAPHSGVTDTRLGRHALDREFEYDPLYRLTRATGRACEGRGPPGPGVDRLPCGAYTDPYGGPPTPNQTNAPELTESYTERYRYDPVGNVISLQNDIGWTQRFGRDGQPPDEWGRSETNRLSSLEQSGETHTFRHDANGNVVGQGANRRYAWDHSDRLVGFTIRQPGSDQPSVEARYLYDADGMRVKKWVRKNGTGDGESTVYIDGVFEHYTNNDTGRSNHRLHVMDDQHRVALVRRGPPHPDDAGPPVQYHLSDHLDSSRVVVDGEGDWINREEYFPYGETSFGGFARKRYQFTGKERDEESGLYYHGARYYIPWAVQWSSCDPAGTAEGVDLYVYARNNPVTLSDPTGGEPEDRSQAYQLEIPFGGDGGEASSPTVKQWSNKEWQSSGGSRTPSSEPSERPGSSAPSEPPPSASSSESSSAAPSSEPSSSPAPSESPGNRSSSSSAPDGPSTDQVASSQEGSETQSGRGTAEGGTAAEPSEPGQEGGAISGWDIAGGGTTLGSAASGAVKNAPTLSESEGRTSRTRPGRSPSQLGSGTGTAESGAGRSARTGRSAGTGTTGTRILQSVDLLMSKISGLVTLRAATRADNPAEGVALSVAGAGVNAGATMSSAGAIAKAARMPGSSKAIRLGGRFAGPAGAVAGAITYGKQSYRSFSRGEYIAGSVAAAAAVGSLLVLLSFTPIGWAAWAGVIGWALIAGAAGFQLGRSF